MGSSRYHSYYIKIGFVWKFDNDLPCDRCKKDVKTLYVDMKKVPPIIFFRLEGFPQILVDHHICRDCWIEVTGRYVFLHFPGGVDI